MRREFFVVCTAIRRCVCSYEELLEKQGVPRERAKRVRELERRRRRGRVLQVQRQLEVRDAEAVLPDGPRGVPGKRRAALERYNGGNTGR